MTAPSHPGLSQLHSKAEALLVAVQYYNLNIEFSGKAKFVPRNQNYRKERSGTHWKHCRMRREEAEGQTKYMSEVCALPRPGCLGAVNFGSQFAATVNFGN